MIIGRSGINEKINCCLQENCSPKYLFVYYYSILPQGKSEKCLICFVCMNLQTLTKTIQSSKCYNKVEVKLYSPHHERLANKSWLKSPNKEPAYISCIQVISQSEGLLDFTYIAIQKLKQFLVC